MPDHTPEFAQPQLPFDEIPYGYCQCGCGKRTEIAPRNDPRWGHIKGEPKLYLPSHQNRLPPEQRFWRSVKRGEEGECWNWQASTDKLGYARVYIAHGRSVLAHRFSYELHNGPIPEGMFVCHKCDNPSCVNPSHLFLGTHQDNTDDMVQKKRHAYGTRNGQSKLTPDDVRAVRKMYRDGMRHEAIAAHYGVSRPAISMILEGARWKHVR